jgi:hypothetical protein
MGFAGGDGNLSRYVHNNVTTFTDPTGLDEKNPLSGVTLAQIRARMEKDKNDPVLARMQYERGYRDVLLWYEALTADYIFGSPPPITSFTPEQLLSKGLLPYSVPFGASDWFRRGAQDALSGKPQAVFPTPKTTEDVENLTDEEKLRINEREMAILHEVGSQKDFNRGIGRALLRKLQSGMELTLLTRGISPPSWTQGTGGPGPLLKEKTKSLMSRTALEYAQNGESAYLAYPSAVLKEKRDEALNMILLGKPTGDRLREYGKNTGDYRPYYQWSGGFFFDALDFNAQALGGSFVRPPLYSRSVRELAELEEKALIRKMQADVARSLEGRPDPNLLRPATPAPATPRPGTLRSVGPDAWESSGGLRYIGRDPDGNNRVQHVMHHAVDDPARAGSHGVFDAGHSGALGTVDEAWAIAQRGGPNVTVQYQPNGRTVYTVDMGRRVGYVGGQGGAASGKPATNHVRIVVQGGPLPPGVAGPTAPPQVISAFPLIP